MKRSINTYDHVLAFCFLVIALAITPELFAASETAITTKSRTTVGVTGTEAAATVNPNFTVNANSRFLVAGKVTHIGAAGSATNNTYKDSKNTLGFDADIIVPYNTPTGLASRALGRPTTDYGYVSGQYKGDGVGVTVYEMSYNAHAVQVGSKRVRTIATYLDPIDMTLGADDNEISMSYTLAAGTQIQRINPASTEYQLYGAPEFNISGRFQFGNFGTSESGINSFWDSGGTDFYSLSISDNINTLDLSNFNVNTSILLDPDNDGTNEFILKTFDYSDNSALLDNWNYSSSSGIYTLGTDVELFNLVLGVAPGHDFDFLSGDIETAIGVSSSSVAVSVVPIPGALILFGSGLLGFFGLVKRQT